MPSSLSVLRIRPRRLPPSVSASLSSSNLTRTSARSALHRAPNANSLAARSSSNASPAFRRVYPSSLDSDAEGNRSTHPRSKHRFPPPTRDLLFPWMPRNTFRSWNSSPGCSDRRWASSIAAEEDDSDSDSDYDSDDELGEAIEEDEIFEENPNDDRPLPPRHKPKLSKRQKRKQSLAGSGPNKSWDVKFLHFRSPENAERQQQELEGDFDRLAFSHDLSRFKWISLLEKSLVLKLRQEAEAEASDTETPDAASAASAKPPRGRKPKMEAPKAKADRLRDYWRVALKAANNQKKVPADLKDHFLSNMVVGAAPASETTAQGEKETTPDKPSGEDQRDVALLVRARELAVDHPLLWRRYSAKERKLKVRLSKKIVRDRAAAILARGDVDDTTNNLRSEEEALLAAAEDKSTALDFYLQHVRIPALRTIHHDSKTAGQREHEALELQQRLKGRLPETSYGKIMVLVQTYVECFGGDANTTDEELVATLLVSPLTPAPQHQPDTNERDPASRKQQDKQKQKQQKQKQKQKQFRVLLSNLRKALPQGRIHWISRDVADFFYVTTPDEVDDKEEDFISSDPILGHSEANWGDVRDQYVQSFLNLQKLFLELEEEHERKQSKALDDQNDEETLNGFLDPNEDPSSEQSVLKTFDTVAALTRMDAKQTSTQRVKPRTYIPLEAMAIGDSWKVSPNNHVEHLIEGQAQQEQQERLQPPIQSSDNNEAVVTSNGSNNSINGAPTLIFGNESFPLNPPVDRLVVIDNLPIDMTESRLREAYGRCGEIDAIEIFHSRPDLDPGRKATDSKKKIRNPSSSSRRQKWSRPRTPLYAMILYRDEASAEKASCEPLRLFGMVLDQHLMRSHRASDMTTLYLEDVPSLLHTVPSMELELSKLLQHSDLYVSLDDSDPNYHHLSLRTKVGGVGKKKKKKKNNSQLLSYTIRFPSFEAAYWSYWKLSMELKLLDTTNPPSAYLLGGPALHWMETPRDSHLYWTRKLNF